jgi:hypothetical protein
MGPLLVKDVCLSSLTSVTMFDCWHLDSCLL